MPTAHQLLGTAHHEAAHAVACVYLDLDFEYVTIVSNAEGSLGHVKSRRRIWSRSTRRSGVVTPHDVVRAEHTDSQFVDLYDKRKLAALVAPILSDEVATSLRKRDPGMWFQYDGSTGEAVFVVSDGAWASRCTVTHVSQEGAARILAECQSSMTAWGEAEFRAAVIRALGATTHTMQ
jgi:hypothetical protein